MLKQPYMLSFYSFLVKFSELHRRGDREKLKIAKTFYKTKIMSHLKKIIQPPQQPSAAKAPLPATLLLPPHR